MSNKARIGIAVAVLAIPLGVWCFGWYVERLPTNAVNYEAAVDAIAAIAAIVVIVKWKGLPRALAVLALVGSISILVLLTPALLLGIASGPPEERDLYTCTACLRADPTRCATHVDHNDLVSNNEDEAREYARTEFCLANRVASGDGSCAKWKPEDFSYTCSKKRGTVPRFFEHV